MSLLLISAPLNLPSIVTYSIYITIFEDSEVQGHETEKEEGGEELNVESLHHNQSAGFYLLLSYQNWIEDRDNSPQHMPT